MEKHVLNVTPKVVCSLHRAAIQDAEVWLGNLVCLGLFVIAHELALARNATSLKSNFTLAVALG